MSQIQKIQRKMLEIVQDEMIMKSRIEEILKTENIHVVISDHRMPKMTGAVLLTKVKKSCLFQA